MTRQEFIRQVESNQRAFRRFLVALCCGDADFADDIAQESLMRAYLSSEGMESPDKFRSWLYRIGFNTFINSRRSQRVTVGYDEAEACAIHTPDSADDCFRYQELYAALNRIPERERTSILLFYMEGYSTREISGIVEVSEDVVRQHLSRGRAHLRKILQ